MAGAGLLAVAAGGWGVYRFKRYVDADPGLCAQCHRASPEFALWTKGSHRGVACQRCHHSSPEQGLAMLRAFLGGRSPAGGTKHAEVELGACATCHLSHDPRWPQIEGSRGHRVHVAGQGIDCVRCHAQAMHGFTPVVETCRGCHGEHAVQAVGMQQLHCFACHDFLSTDPGLRPTRADCLRCHRESGVHPGRFSAAAPMQLDCAACHHPHARTPAEERIPCLGCHAGVPRAGLHASRGHRRCLDCHEAHLWKSGDARCGGCHRAPHAEGRGCARCHGFHGAGEPLPPRPGAPRAGP
ncbi:MAG TPA: hypothetical protein VH880_04625 [Anaeromyxobacteraceae bacterium]